MEKQTKICFKCGRELPLTEFYKHPQMGDGHLNKCKECTKNDVHKKYLENSENHAYIEKERARGREKYHRLNYKEKSRGRRDLLTQYGIRNRAVDVRRYYRCRGIEFGEDIEFHHWNYDRPNDVFVLDRRAHKRVHRDLTLDMEKKIFICNGEYLDSYEKHLEHIKQVLEGTNFTYTRLNL